jgi:hypothetical protein
MAIERARKFGDFQAEYEGSIPFTRSNNFKHLLGIFHSAWCTGGVCPHFCRSMRYRLAPSRIEFRHQLGVERSTNVTNQWNPNLGAGPLVDDAQNGPAKGGGGSSRRSPGRLVAADGTVRGNGGRTTTAR